MSLNRLTEICTPNFDENPRLIDRMVAARHGELVEAGSRSQGVQALLTGRRRSDVTTLTTSPTYCGVLGPTDSPTMQILGNWCWLNGTCPS